MNILAIDIGGTNIKAGLIDASGQIIKRWKFPTEQNDLWNGIVRGLGDYDRKSVKAIGISMPGFIDHDKNIVTLSGNLNLHNYNIGKELKHVFPDQQVFVINDAKAATLGEYAYGQNKQFANMLMYTLGTGIGGGIILDHKLYFGKNGYAGEFGHGGNFQHQIKCNCGLPSCIEPVSSALGMERALKAAHIDLTLEQALSAVKNKTPNSEKIKQTLFMALEPLAYHIMMMQAALNPEAIIIGGGPSAQGETIKALIDKHIKEKQLDFLAKETPIIIAKTQNDAGLFGAAYWAKMKGQKIWK